MEKQHASDLGLGTDIYLEATKDFSINQHLYSKEKYKMAISITCLQECCLQMYRLFDEG